MRREEENIQIAFFEWTKWQEGRYPELKLMHHIPNGGKRNKAEAAIFKAMGVKSGVPDIFLPAPKGVYHGLYIELKSGTGKPSKNQEEFINSLHTAGYFVCVCDNLDSLIKTVQRYLNLPKVNLTYLLLDKFGELTADTCMM